MTKKKNYITNIQEGFIRKTTLNDFFTRSQSYEIKLIKIDHASGQYEGTFKGKIKQMSYSRNFEDKVLEFMKDMNEFVKEQKEFNNSVVDFMKEQKEFNNSVVDFMKEQKEFNQKVDQRLSILEKDMKEIKSLPTIKDELKNK
ncbi:hypothetical protein ACJA29_01310 [Metamycoplasma sualvi]|uniref:hypothetical protein n=1 Tax=Metamycoplasma sualvi TaxID=2125 RepID=UPI003872A89B